MGNHDKRGNGNPNNNNAGNKILNYLGREVRRISGNIKDFFVEADKMQKAQARRRREVLFDLGKDAITEVGSLLSGKGFDTTKIMSKIPNAIEDEISTTGEEFIELLRGIFNAPDWWVAPVPGLNDQPYPAVNLNRPFNPRTMQAYTNDILAGAQIPLSVINIDVNKPLNEEFAAMIRQKYMAEIRAKLGTNYNYTYEDIDTFINFSWILAFHLARLLRDTKMYTYFDGQHVDINEIFTKEITDVVRTGLVLTRDDPELTASQQETWVTQWDKLRAILSTVPIPPKFFDFAMWLTGTYAYDDTHNNRMYYRADVRFISIGGERFVNGQATLQDIIKEVTDFLNIPKMGVLVADLLTYSENLAIINLPTWDEHKSTPIRFVHDHEWFNAIDNAYTYLPDLYRQDNDAVLRFDWCDEVVGTPAMAPAMLWASGVLRDDNKKWIVRVISQSLLFKTYDEMQIPDYNINISNETRHIDSDIVFGPGGYTPDVYAINIATNASSVTSVSFATESSDPQTVDVYSYKTTVAELDDATLLSVSGFTLEPQKDAPIMEVISEGDGKTYIILATQGDPLSGERLALVVDRTSVETADMAQYSIAIKVAGTSTWDTLCDFGYYNTSAVGYTDSTLTVRTLLSSIDIVLQPSPNYLDFFTGNAQINFSSTVRITLQHTETTIQSFDDALAMTMFSQCEHHIPMIFAKTYSVNGTSPDGLATTSSPILLKEINNPAMVTMTDFEQMQDQMAAALSWFQIQFKDKKRMQGSNNKTHKDKDNQTDDKK